MNAIHDVATLDLNLLPVLDLLLETASTTETARRLGRTQSAVSHALARLRELFGDPLFVREGSRLRPTSRAEALRIALVRWKEVTDTLLSAPEAHFQPQELRRVFAMGLTDNIEQLLLPNLLPRLRRDAPGVDVHTRYLADALEHAVQSRQVDVGVGTTFRGLAGLVQHKLFDDRLVCVLRRGHPVLRRPWNLQTFLSLDQVLVAPRGLPGSTVDAALEAEGRSRRVVLRIPHFATALTVVSSTELLVTLPERYAQSLQEPLGLVLREPPLRLPPFRFSMIFHEAVRADAAHAWLRGCVLESVPELAPRRSRAGR